MADKATLRQKTVAAEKLVKKAKAMGKELSMDEAMRQIDTADRERRERAAKKGLDKAFPRKMGKREVFRKEKS